MIVPATSDYLAFEIGLVQLRNWIYFILISLINLALSS